MDRIDDPVQLTHPKLRAFAYQAAWIAAVAEAARDWAIASCVTPLAAASCS